MGFVNDQNHSALASVAIEQKFIERRNQLAAGAPFGGEAKFLTDRLEEFDIVVAWIEENRDFAVRLNPFEQAPTKSRFAGPHLPGKNDEALPLLKAVDKVCQGLPVGVRQIEERGIGCQRKRFFAETIESGIHGG